MSATDRVLTLGEVSTAALGRLLARYGLELRRVAPGATIPGSYWGDSEAGLVDTRVLARADTPVHSILHESCHYVCMPAARRQGLHTDAGGDYDEENAVCYLQIVLADALPDVGRRRMQTDMDAWGYTFRLGSARRWFDEDAMDVRDWLARHGVLDASGEPTWRLRR